jgi:hypothetical protein
LTSIAARLDIAATLSMLASLRGYFEAIVAAGRLAAKVGAAGLLSLANSLLNLTLMLCLDYSR